MHTTQELISKISEQARALFESKRHNCAQAVLLALNEVLGGGLDPDTAARLASGLGGGLGKSGCACGTLTGGVLALGLFAGSESTLLGRSKSYKLAGRLHERFKKRFGSSCCRVLTRSMRGSERRTHCSAVTTATAAMCAEILIAEKPELAV